MLLIGDVSLASVTGFGSDWIAGGGGADIIIGDGRKLMLRPEKIELSQAPPSAPG